MIERVYNRSGPIVYYNFDLEIIPLRVILSLLFNTEIERLIRDNKAIVVYDASVKDRRIGGYWILMTMEKRILIEKELFSK